jgi:hypothetical protein
MKIASAIIIIFFLLLLKATYNLFKQGRLPTRSFVFWSLVWVSSIVFLVFPELLDMIMYAVEMRVRVHFLFLALTMILFAFLLSTSASISEMRQHITKLTREIAILEYKIKQYEKEE